MTRKEAAGVIKFEKACVLRQDTPRCNRDCKKCDLLLPTEDVLTAYDMAIKALKQKPCGDAISRQAVLEIVEREQYKGDALQEIEKLPFVKQQDQKIGHWIPLDDYNRRYSCSECLHSVIDFWELKKQGVSKLFNYCPNCGRKMVEEE